jgi:hypothetical protein
MNPGFRRFTRQKRRLNAGRSAKASGGAAAVAIIIPFANAPPALQKMRVFRSNRVEVKIKEADCFLQKIAGIRHVMVAGSYPDAIRKALAGMNVDIVGPSDPAAPAV